MSSVGRVAVTPPAAGSGNGTAQPLVSIIVPAYNAERFIGGTLTSLLGQTYPNIEIMVYDDASTDTTAEIARSFGDAKR